MAEGEASIRLEIEGELDWQKAGEKDEKRIATLLSYPCFLENLEERGEWIGFKQVQMSLVKTKLIGLQEAKKKLELDNLHQISEGFLSEYIKHKLDQKLWI